MGQSSVSVHESGGSGVRIAKTGDLKIGGIKMDEENRRTTPCDYPDENGEYHCPYADTYTGYESEMCRVCCGLGVDE